MSDFKVGSTVQLTEQAALKSKFPDRRGIVVAISKSGTQIRVRWSGLRGAESVHYSLLKPAVDDNDPDTPSYA